MTTSKGEPNVTKKAIQAIKGFNPDMTCQGFQFAEGETYEIDGPVEVCRTGFHAVTQPIDVFRYYKPATSVFHKVQLEDVQTHSEDSKVATASGYSGAATASGEYGMARGSIGNALFLAERDADWKIINVAAVIVDGKKIKADTYYTLRSGKVLES